jgi:hypothetical protein
VPKVSEITTTQAATMAVLSAATQKRVVIQAPS